MAVYRTDSPAGHAQVDCDTIQYTVADRVHESGPRPGPPFCGDGNVRRPPTRCATNGQHSSTATAVPWLCNAGRLRNGGVFFPRCGRAGSTRLRTATWINGDGCKPRPARGGGGRRCAANGVPGARRAMRPTRQRGRRGDGCSNGVPHRNACGRTGPSRPRPRGVSTAIPTNGDGLCSSTLSVRGVLAHTAPGSSPSMLATWVRSSSRPSIRSCWSCTPTGAPANAAVGRRQLGPGSVLDRAACRMGFSCTGGMTDLHHRFSTRSRWRSRPCVGVASLLRRLVRRHGAGR
jgi:hypothetical protein